MLKHGTKGILALVAMFLVTLACGGAEAATAAEPQPAAQKGTAKEQPKEQPKAPAAAGDQGKAVYQKTCAACHDTGVSGAPKLGDKAAWASRIAKGKGPLVQSVVKGMGAMPPKAGNAALSEGEIQAAVGYMVEQAR